MNLSIISLEARWKARLESGAPVFVKASGSHVASWRADARRRVAKDRACLDALAGLAVPRRVRLPQDCLLPGVRPSDAVAEEWVPGAPLDKAGLSKAQLLGAWAFVAEQMTAFRRRQVLYSDLKCANVLARRRPLSVRIIDFDFATAVEAGGSYRSRDLGFTPGFEAPEQARRERRLSERTVVYQLGMLLLHCWTGARSHEVDGASRGLPRLRRELEALGAGKAAGLAEACLAQPRAKRPSGYEEVLRRLKDAQLPAAAASAWSSLRAPYARALTGVGLEA